jgi:hypothetical protein
MKNEDLFNSIKDEYWNGNSSIEFENKDISKIFCSIEGLKEQVKNIPDNEYGVGVIYVAIPADNEFGATIISQAVETK